MMKAEVALMRLNRRVRNRTHGGVRGRGYLAPPTRLQVFYLLQIIPQPGGGIGDQFLINLFVLTSLLRISHAAVSFALVKPAIACPRPAGESDCLPW